MSSLAALYALYCYCDYDPTPEDIELARKLAEEQKEREKHMIVSAYQFGQLARTDPESGALGVKFLRDKNGVFHWMDTKIWQFHYTYCVSNLDEKRTLQEFNEQVYTGKDRSMMFATVVAYRGPDRKYCCLELNPADPMNDIDFVEAFFKEVNSKFSYDSEPIYFHPTSPAQLAAVKGANLSLPVITSDVLFSGIKYKLVQAGTITQKKVSIFDKPQYTEDDLNKWLLQRTADDVVVIPRVPNDIPVVGGVICGEIIPPLCHVALLCQNRKTPCCFAQNCLKLMEEGHFSPSAKTVASGVITKKGFYLDGEAPSTNVPEENPHVEVPQANTSVTNLIDIHEDKQHAKDIQIIGAKAAQLATIESIYNQPIFKGTFVIPFHHYNKHMHQNTVISSALGKLPQVSKSNPNFTDYHIKGYNLFQEIIQKEKADDELVQSVIEKIKRHNMTSVIFRSSTNAEDLTGFNGAGLYESVPLFGNNVHDPQQVEAAIKKVWASVWNVKAVKERDHYQIPHDNVNMAVIVQPFIDEHMKGVKVHYNGVCITHDIVHHKLKHGFTISCYPGHALRATNYYNDKVPEQAVLLLGRATNSVDVQVNATATGQPYSLITQQDAEKMVSVFGTLHTSMLNKPHKLDDTVALDIEFMVISSVKDLKKRDLVVLQARPYTISTVDTEALDKEFITFAEANFGYSLHSASKVYLSNIVNNYCASKETNTLY